MPDDDDEISIDVSKITKFFKKKKDVPEEELQKAEQRVEEDIKEQKIEIKELKDREIDKEEKLEKFEEKKEELEEIKEEVEEETEKLEVLKEEEKDIKKEETKEEEIIEKQEEKIEKVEEDIEKIEEGDEEVAIDFGKIAGKVKNLFKFGKKKENGAKKIFEEKEEAVVSGIKGEAVSILDFFKKNKYAIPVLLILIAIVFSTFFRMYPASLPVTDNWAEDNVGRFYKNQIQSEINSQYPNLPDANKKALIENKYREVLKQQKSQIDQQIAATSQQFKSRFQDENGQTYLLAIDPYYWYNYARNYINNGHFGDSYNEDGDSWISVRNGRQGRSADTKIPFHTYLGVFVYRIAQIFSDVPLLNIFFLLPVLVIGLSIIPAFFIGKRLGGNLGGFFAAMIVAVNSALLGRTPAGFADTDPYNILFPLFIAWMFIEAFEAKSFKKSAILASIGSVFCLAYSYSWGGWWYVFDFIIATIGLFLIYQLILNANKIKHGFVNYLSTPGIKNTAITGSIFFFGSAILISLFKGISTFTLALRGPTKIVELKDVAITKLWPNVLTTVAEFNEVSLPTIISQMGGQLLFWLALIGITLLLFNRKKMNFINIAYLIGSSVYYIIMIMMKNKLTNPITFVIIMGIPVIVGLIKIIYLKESEDIDIKAPLFLMIWFIGTAYGFTKGIRFAILMVPAFAIAVGACVGIIYGFLTQWLSKEMHINKYISKTVILILLCLLLIAPIKSANSIALNEIPSMNDAWYDSLTAIKQDSTDAIITSWWDFGHWFYTISERRVTFDGGNQGERIHWVGKSLLTEDEDVNIGILKMLNCGQQKAPHVLEGYLDGDTVKAISVLNDIMLEDKKGARGILEEEGLGDNEIEEVLKYTHCDDLIDQYYITSEDMIGKAGVWGHFGSWSFRKAKMWQSVVGKDVGEGTRILREDFNLSEEKADNYYYEIQNTKADRWISPWPGYLSGLNGCNVENGLIRCGNGVEINMSDMKATISIQQGKAPLKSLAFIDSEGEFKIMEYGKDTSPYSAALIPDGNSYKSILLDPLHAGSMFTRLFFFDGHGLKHFTLFSDKSQITGGRIQVWKVSWEAGEPINTLEDEVEIEENSESEESKEVKASHILISTDDRTDEEALKLIEDIAEKINSTNFAELAKEFSEGPSGKNGGDLGWFGKGQMVKEFENVVFNLTENEISNPVKTQFGYHIIKLVDKRKV